MSIYVRVGDEVIEVSDGASGRGRSADCPIEIEVVVDQARRALDRQAVAGKVGAAPTYAQIASVAAADQHTRAAIQVAVDTAAPPKPWVHGETGSVSVGGQTSGYAQLAPRELAAEAAGIVGWRRVAGEERWVQVMGGQVVAELGIDEIAGELNALVAESGAPRKAAAVDLGRAALGTVTITQVAGKFVEKKPRVVVNAVRWTGDNWGEVEAWLRTRAEDAENLGAGIVTARDEEGYRLKCVAPGWFVGKANGDVVVLSDEKFAHLYVPAPAWDAESGASIDVLRAALDGVPRGGASGAAPEWIVRLHRAACAVAGIEVCESPAPVESGDPDAEQFNPFAELVKWRRWSSALLKDDGFQDDELRRKKLTAVLEAPSAMPADIVPREAGDPVVEACARVAHEVYRAGFGDPAMPEWDLAPEHERSVARESAAAALSGTTPEEWHVRWTGKLLDEGWEYGPVKDEANKRHPNLVVYSSLPAEQRLLDQVFAAAVVATAQALEAYEEAFAVPVLRVAGDIGSEQFASFRREWERQVAGSSAWKTPIFPRPRPAGRHRGEPVTSIVDQPPPIHRPDLIPVWEHVISDFRVRYEDAFDGIDAGDVGKVAAHRVLADMAERDRLGRERYGTPLTTNNGRDHLVDAYQELLDAAVYLKAAWLEGEQVRDAYYAQLDVIMKIRMMLDAREANK